MGMLMICAPAGLVAQLPTTISAVVGVVEHETTLYGLSATEGPVFGGEVAVSPFHFTDFSLQVTAGTLTAATSGTSDQSYTDVRLAGSAQALPWLSFRLGFDARGYGEPLGTQRWLRCWRVPRRACRCSTARRGPSRAGTSAARQRESAAESQLRRVGDDWRSVPSGAAVRCRAVHVRTVRLPEQRRIQPARSGRDARPTTRRAFSALTARRDVRVHGHAGREGRPSPRPS